MEIKKCRCVCVSIVKCEEREDIVGDIEMMTSLHLVIIDRDIVLTLLV